MRVQPPQQFGGLLFGGIAVLGDNLLGQSADPLNPLGGEHLGGGGIGDLDGVPRRRDLPVEQLVDAPDRVDLAEGALDVVLIDRRDAVATGLGRPGLNAVVDPGDLAGRSEHDALMVELGGDQPPTRVLLADEHLGRHADIVVVGRIGVVRTVGQDDRRPGVAGVLGVDDEDRDPLVLGRFRVGAAGQPDVVGVMATGGPDLLAVDDVLITVADRGGAQCRQVGAGLRFGVADGEVHLAGQDRRKELLLLQLGAVDLQRRTDGLQGDRGKRHFGARGLIDEDLLLDRAEAQASELLGPAHAELAVRAHPPDDRAVGLTVTVDLHLRCFFRRNQVLEILPELGLQLPLLGCQFDVHCAPTSSSR